MTCKLVCLNTRHFLKKCVLTEGSAGDTEEDVLKPRCWIHEHAKVFSRTVGKGGECLQKCGKACWEWNKIRDQKNKKEQSL